MLEDHLYVFIELYHSLPKFIKNFVGKVYRKIPKKLRYGKFYFDYKKRMSEFCLLEEVQKEDLIKLLLFKQVNYALENLKYYENTNLINSLDEFKKLPIINKEVINTNKDNFIVLDKKSLSLKANTGGSSGNPFTFFLHKGVTRAKEKAHFNVYWRKYGYNEDSKLLVIRGKALRKNKIFEYDTLNNSLIINCNSINENNILELYDQIKIFKPEFIHAYPSALKVFTILLNAKLNINEKRPSFKALFLGSEQLFQEDIKLFNSFYESQIVNWYGHSESLVLAERIDNQEVFEVCSTYGYLELIDYNDRVINEIGQTGRIVATGFDNQVMPLVRYDTGDEGVLVRMSEKDKIVTQISNISGRDKNYIYLKDKTQVTLTSIIFGEHHNEFEYIKEFQIEQFEFGVIHLYIVPLEGYEQRDFKSLKKKLDNLVSIGNLTVVLSIIEKTTKTHRGKNVLLKQNIKL